MMRYLTDPTSFPRSLPFWSPFLEYSGCILSFRFHFDWFWALLKQSPSSLTNCRSFLCLYFVFKVHCATLHVIFSYLLCHFCSPSWFPDIVMHTVDISKTTVARVSHRMSSFPDISSFIAYFGYPFAPNTMWEHFHVVDISPKPELCLQHPVKIQHPASSLHKIVLSNSY